MEAIGNRLKKAREKKKLTLEDAQKALKIHPSILRALEENKAHELLSPVYVRSFLKTYARYLELNAEKIVGEYSEKHLEKPEQILHLDEKKLDVAAHIKSIKSLKKYMPMAAKITATILALILALFVLRGAFRFTKTRIASALNRIKTAREAGPAATVAQRPSINIPRNEPLTLVVKTKEDVWMQVKSDGEVIFKRVLPKENIETWKAKKAIELWVGNAQALELVLNGIPLGSPGRGVKKGILINHKGMKLP